MAVPDRLSAQSRPEHLTADDDVGALMTAHRDQQELPVCNHEAENTIQPQSICVLRQHKWFTDIED